jgi:hypothetical protein
MKNRRFAQAMPHLAALLIFAALTVLALDNLILNFGQAVVGTPGGDTDYAQFYWDPWWMRYALVNLHTNPFYTNYVLYPIQSNLSVHALVPLLGLVALPLQSLFDVTPIVNGWIAGSFVLTGYCTFLFLRRQVRDDWLAALGGVIFAFNPLAIQRAVLAHTNMVPGWWIPLALLLWDVMADRRSRWAAIGLGLSMYAAWMCDFQLPMWTLMLLVPYAIYRLAKEPAWGDPLKRTSGRWRVIGLTALAVFVTLLPALVAPLPQIMQTRGLNFPRVDMQTLRLYSFPLQSFFTRSPDNWFTIGQLLPLLTLLALPLSGPRRQRWLWLGIGLAMFVLALGPYWGKTSIPMPYLLMDKIFQGMYRTPWRFATPGSLALITFVALSLRHLFDRFPRIARWRVPLVVALTAGFVFDFDLPGPFPVIVPTDYQVYRTIGADPQESTLLEVPLAAYAGFGGVGDIRAADLQYYVIYHHKRVVNGTLSRVPIGALDRYRNNPLLYALTGEAPLPPLDAASAELTRRIERWDVRYIVVHRQMLSPEPRRALVEFFNVQPSLCLWAEEADVLAYRVVKAWADCPAPNLIALQNGRIDLGASWSDRFVGPGWYGTENVGGPQARWTGEAPTSTLRVWLSPGATHVLFRALAYPPDERVTIVVNGQTLAEIALAQDWADYAFDIPASVIGSEPSFIELRHTEFGSPVPLQGSTTDRPLAAAYQWFEFTLIP